MSLGSSSREYRSAIETIFYEDSLISSRGGGDPQACPEDSIATILMSMATGESQIRPNHNALLQAIVVAIDSFQATQQVLLLGKGDPSRLFVQYKDDHGNMVARRDAYIKANDLQREDLDNLLEVTQWLDPKNILIVDPEAHHILAKHLKTHFGYYLDEEQFDAFRFNLADNGKDIKLS